MSMDFSMDFNFNYGGMTLDKPEAAALLQASSPKGTKPFEIDLSKLIDVRVVDSNKLFKLSVDQQNPALASLAFKLATANVPTTPKATHKVVITDKEPVPSSTGLMLGMEPLEIIADLNKSACYRSVGTAVLLHYANTVDSRAMRDIASEFVNDCLTTHKMKKTSIAFRGFTQGSGGKLEPIDNAPKIPRRDTYPVSPVYISLREGLIYCERHGLLSIRQNYSVGSLRSDASPLAEKLKRMYYTFKLTDKGNEVKEYWGDMESFIVKFFKSRHV
jgi:hypothetical protein